MARPKKKRCICKSIKEYTYIPDCGADGVEQISGDEMEAVRLADYLGMHQEDACKKMKVSRQTFGRIVENARKKIAGGLLKGKKIVITRECGEERKNG